MAVGIGILGLAFLLGLLGILAAGFVLLFRRGTWPIGLVLIGFPAVVILLGAALFTVRSVEVHQSQAQARLEQSQAYARIQMENEETLRQRLAAEQTQIRETRETVAVAAAAPEPAPAPEPATTVATGAEEAKPEPRSEDSGTGVSPAEAAPEVPDVSNNSDSPGDSDSPDSPGNSGNSAEPPAESPKAMTVPVNSVTTFGLIVKALANAIDSELPSNISGDEALLALEKTVNEELPRGTSESGLITALGKVIGRAVAEKHNEIATEGDVEATSPVPEWISRSSGKVDGVYQTVVKVGPFTTDLECENSLKAALETAVNDYVGLYMGEKAQDSAVGLPEESLEKEIVVEKFQQRIETSVGPMVQLFALVKFDNRTNELLKESWEGIEIRDRLLVAGLGFGGLLLLITFVYGVLRLDVATEGKMRGRLILGVLTACVLLGILIPRAFQDSQYRETLDQAHQLVGLHTVAQEAATGGGAGVQGRPATIVMLVPAILFLVGIILCFRPKTRKLGIGLLVCVALLVGTGLFFLA